MAKIAGIKNVSREELKTLRQLYLSGMSGKEIAQRVGRSQATVSRLTKRMRRPKVHPIPASPDYEKLFKLALSMLVEAQLTDAIKRLRK